MSSPTVTVVIPTRNRPDSLERLLASLAEQRRPPEAIIVVDASDDDRTHRVCDRSTSPVPLSRIPSLPSVCKQRNNGIRAAATSHILLCDDDISVPSDYLERLVSYLVLHPEDGAVGGLLAGPNGGLDPPRIASTAGLLWSWLFQLSVTSDLASEQAGGMLRRALRRWYVARGNATTLAGWPLLTDMRGPAFRTKIYGLGGGVLVRIDWLERSPYDELLDANGIGDNYGVAMGFPGERGIVVLTDLVAFHYAAKEGRIDDAGALFHRIIALDYFLFRSSRRTLRSRAFLRWSLVGLTFVHAFRENWASARAVARALPVLVFGRNPIVGRYERSIAEGRR